MEESPLEEERNEIDGSGRTGERRSCVGIIAGDGRLPVEGARAARAQDVSVVAIGVTPGVDPELAQWVDAYAQSSVGDLTGVLRRLRDFGAESVYLLGKVQKSEALNGSDWDERLVELVAGLPRLTDDVLLNALAGALHSEGFTVGKQTELLASLLPEPGVLSGGELSDSAWADIAFGYESAKLLAGADIGQTVIVKDGVVWAVEAGEGTDEAVRRGGRLAREGCVVVKVSRPRQDPRFDVPTVGLETLAAVREARGAVLAFEAGATLLVDRPRVVAAADEAGIAVVAYAPRMRADAP